jgi:hypothetical protein
MTANDLIENNTMTTDRFQIMTMQQRYHTLAKVPYLQAEAIADHYLSVVTIAMKLKELVELRKQLPSCETSADQLIERLKNEIANHHQQSFGIGLTWIDCCDER